MNKCYFLSLFILSILATNWKSHAQATIDFESGGTGASYTWAVFENDDNPALSIEANPNASGINTSSTVAKFTARTAGQPYAGTESAHGDFGPLTFTATNSTIKLMVYKTIISDVGLKFAENNGEAQPEIKVANTKINEWEELTFDLSGSIGTGITGVLDQIIVFPDFAGRSEDHIIYFDNISFSGDDPGNSDELELVWSDEFSTDGAINGNNWHHQTQLPNGGGWFNGEEQHYTDELANSSVQNGNLSITAKKESYTDQGFNKQYTSARLNSKFAFTYGRVEVRAKLPSGNGTWPAIWTLGKNINEDGGFWDATHGDTSWPACGEIDIMEHWGNNQNFVQSALHTPSSSGSTENHGGQTIATVTSEFHVYELDWTAEKMVFSVDGTVHYTYNPAVKDASTWPFDAPQYLLLNVAMGGVGGAIDPAFVESSMEIDYVRVYQKESDQTVLTEPDVAATAPTVDPLHVISIFSDTYTDVAGTVFDPDWGQSTVSTQVDIAGNNTLKYENLNYQGTQLGSTQDVSAMKSLHIDFWTADATALEVSLISSGPLENKSALTITTGRWVSVNVPLTEFTVPALNDIIQLKFDGNGTVYLDNIYFTSDDGTVSTDTSLSDLLVDGQTIAGFSTNTLDYTMVLAAGTTTVPTVTAVSTDNTSTMVITPASDLPGSTTIVVTSADGGSKSTYSVTFSVESTPPPPATFPIDFEGDAYGFIDFDGGVATVIDNPQLNSDNSSTKVAQIVRDGGAVWGGSKLILADKIDFSVNNAFSIKVYSTRADVPVLLKLEGPNAAKEVIVNTTIANGWETMTWDYSDTPSDTYDEIVFMFDIGTVGDSSINSTYYFDDVEFYDNTGGLSQIDLPVTFEDASVNYTVTDFGENSTVLGADPDDATNTVAITTKTTGAATWAGTTVGTPTGFDNAIPFSSSETKVNVKIYSPAAGLPIRIKVEDHNNVTLTAETEASTTKANEWEVLTFDFSQVVEGTNPFNLSTNFDMLSIFFNFGTEGTGQVFYWDDVLFGQGTVIDPVLSLKEDFDVSVYGNESRLVIKGDNSLINSRVEVYNLSGRKVKEAIISTKNTTLKINQKGLLIVRISGVNGALSRKVILK